MRGQTSADMEEGPMSVLQNMITAKGSSAPTSGFFDEYMSDLKEQSDNGIGSFMVAYRLSGEAKVKGVCEFIETLSENGAKFLVFAHHKSVMDGLQDFCKQKKIGHIRIDGKVSTEVRHERVKAFQTEQSVRCAILSIQAAS